MGKKVDMRKLYKSSFRNETIAVDLCERDRLVRDRILGLGGRVGEQVGESLRYLYKDIS